MISYTSTLAVSHLFRERSLASILRLLTKVGEHQQGMKHAQPFVLQDVSLAADGEGLSIFEGTVFFFDGFRCRFFR